MKDVIILVGAGGHSKAIIEVIDHSSLFKIGGLIDQNLSDKDVLGYKIIGNDQSLNILVNKIKYAFPAIGFIDNPTKRAKLYAKLKKLGFKIPNIISSRSYTSERSIIGDGNIVMHDALISVDNTIGSNNIIQSKALLDHEVVIGDHNYISTSSTLNGGVQIGNFNLIGSNAVINHGCTIGNNIKIGSGAVVVKNITKPGTYIGVPARRID